MAHLDDPDVLRGQLEMRKLEEQLQEMFGPDAQSVEYAIRFNELIDNKNDVKEASEEEREAEERKKRIAALQEENERLQKEKADLKCSTSRLEAELEELRARVRKSEPAGVSNATPSWTEETKEEPDEQDEQDESDDEIIFH